MSEGAAQGQIGTKRRFAAFISYAHADADIAAKLQSRLERYRLPKHIALTHAEGDAALGKIFRDREDLAAAPSLSEAIRAAIAEAEALVVIASPDARASRWVGEEIALFRQLHPKGQILAVLVRGAPEEAFPVALTANGTEPLAADLRAKGDGEALGFLKIVAGIAGVPLDALVQRDAQRRLRRVTAITVGALAAMLIMGIMTAFAIQSRNEAARQRAEAEGLVEYMLTDLREKLKGVGRLDIMEAVNSRAKAYYGDESIKGRLLNAQVLHAMGEDLEKQGQLDKAATKFREAYKSTSQLARSNPNNSDVIFTHAQSEYWAGRIAQLKGDWATAHKNYVAYQALANSLLKLSGDRKRALLEIGHAELNLGIVAMNGENGSANARAHFWAAKRAYAGAARLGEETDQQIYFRANAAAWLADTYFAEQQWDASVAQRQEELALNQRVADRDANNADASFLVAKTQLALGKNLLKLQNAREAEHVLDNANVSLAKLVALDPANTDWAYMYFRTISNLAIASAQNGNPAKAHTYLDSAIRFAAKYRFQDVTLYMKMQEGISATKAAT